MGNGQSRDTWGDGYRQMTPQQIYSMAQTGDILLFKGDGADAALIRCMSVMRTWSHVGVVIVLPNGRKLVTEAYPTVIAPDVIRGGDRHTGVQAVDLLDRIRNYPSGMVAYRSIRRSNGLKTNAQRNVPSFVKIVKSWDTDEVPQYSTFLEDWLEYGTRSDDDDNIHNGLKHYVCTSWAASVWMHLGIVTKAIRPGNYLLSDYGFPYDRSLSTFKPDLRFSEIMYIKQTRQT